MFICAGSLIACEDDDPAVTPMAGEVQAGEMQAGEVQAGEMQAGEMQAGEMMTECIAVETDYPAESWPMCISDSGRYELAGANTPSSAARVAAYETIADLLWRNEQMTAEDFIQAELIYGEDGGVGSRVTRRYDAHLTMPEGADCAADEAAELWPDYCVGPAQIEPLILNAFTEGNMGQNMESNAAKIKAGLLWFFYVSTYKEAYTCAGKAADCDSHWAYCNGAKQLDEEPFALGAEIKAASETAYKSLFDAHLAIRCWRDLDSAEVAENTELHVQVLDQLERALDYGYAQMLISHLNQISDGESQQIDLIGLSILGPQITRAALLRDPMLDLEAWQSNWTGLPTANTDVINQLSNQLQTLFTCP